PDPGDLQGQAALHVRRRPQAWPGERRGLQGRWHLARRCRWIDDKGASQPAGTHADEPQQRLRLLIADSAAQDTVQRPRDRSEVEAIDEQAGIAGLAPRSRGDEPPKLLVDGSVTPGRHLLKLAEPVQIAVRGKDLLDPRRAKRADQLVLQVRVTYVEVM